MDKTVSRRLLQANEKAFVNHHIEAEEDLTPSLVCNDASQGRKVLCVLEKELRECTSFEFSVAFISMSGIVPLLDTFALLEKKGVPGKILTTDYLQFSDPKALDVLDSFSNLEVRMVQTEETDGFHVKSYLFEKDGLWHSIVGSSNLTGSALTSNDEWNTRLVSMDEGEYLLSLRDQFDRLWNGMNTPLWSMVREHYILVRKLAYEQNPRFFRRPRSPQLKPNTMQTAFTRNLQELMQNGENRALLVSATGTGKTYAAAFAMKAMDVSKVLFVIHREQIARTALESFRRVLGPSYTYGLLSGNHHDVKADCLFATVQTLSKPEVLSSFDPQRYDVIILDECHRSGSTTTLRLFDHFNPRLWLGMSATPQRMDGFDIYALFDHNIACEISLPQAMEEDLLCPFHYFGISDLEYDDEKLEEEEAGAMFRMLHLEQRADHMMEKAQFYGFSGKRVHGLIFVSRNDEAFKLEEILNRKGWRTKALSGASSQELREQSIERLIQDEDNENALDYLITVDIFNEGVDIPEVNQVLLLRPTQSCIVFVQQLGRGLRKNQEKEYTIVLDFIGSYTNNYMIPMAIFDDHTYSKDNLRRVISTGSSILPGQSTIHFDEISRRRIFASIDQANFSDKKRIREAYCSLKEKLGRVPTLMDFEIHGSVDPSRIFAAFGSLYKLKTTVEKQPVELNPIQMQTLELVSTKYGTGKRDAEPFLLLDLIKHPDISLEQAWKDYEQTTGKKPDRFMKQNIQNQFLQDYYPVQKQSKYKKCVFIEEQNGSLKMASSFARQLEDPLFENELKEVLEYALHSSKTHWSPTYKDSGFVLNQKYTYEEIMRILSWQKEMVSLNIGGYFFDQETNTYPIFINYHKEEGISESTQYEDQFSSPSRLIAISKGKRSLESPDVRSMLEADRNNTKVDLFVRKDKKDKSDSKEFYYLGRMHPANVAPEEFTMADGKTRAVRIYWDLEKEVRPDLYEYITNVAI